MAQPTDPGTTVAKDTEPTDPGTTVAKVKMVHGVTEEEFAKMTPLERANTQIADKTSNLANQVTNDDIALFQLISNTPADTISAMSGKSIAELKIIADELGITLKSSLAGDFTPPKA